MINAKIYRQKNQICGFRMEGHAGYARHGQDIVCAAVTVLVLNTVNALERFTDTAFVCEADVKNGGFIKVDFPEGSWQDSDTQLLLQTMALGLADVEKEYQRFITLEYEEVQLCSD